MAPTTEHIASDHIASDAIVFDASPVRSQWCRRRIEGTLEGLSLTRSEDIWQTLLGAHRRLPRNRAVVVGDLHELTSLRTLDELAAGPSFLAYVLLVRTTLDKKRLAEPDIALRLNDDRFFVFDLECSKKAREATQLELMSEFFRRFIERLQPDRVRTARFSAIDGILWLEFGDGLNRAAQWDSLPFARQLGFAPVSASAREHGQAVQLIDADGREVDIDAGALRALADPAHLERLQDEDQSQRSQLGGRLRRVREQLGLSQEQVADRSGIAQESLSRIETGRRDPRLETLRKLSRGLGMTLPELLESLSSSD